MIRLLICAATMFATTFSYAQGEVSATDTLVSDSMEINWVYDSQIALDKAKERKTVVLYYFYADENDNCKALEHSVFTSPNVIEAFKTIIPIKCSFMDNSKLAYNLWLFGSGTFAVVEPQEGTVLARADVKTPITTSEELLTLIANSKATAKATAEKAEAKEETKKTPAEKAKVADEQTSPSM